MKQTNNSVLAWQFFKTKIQSKHFWRKKIKEEKMEESLGLGKKSYGTETDTETWSWFRLPIPKPGFGRTLCARNNNHGCTGLRFNNSL